MAFDLTLYVDRLEPEAFDLALETYRRLAPPGSWVSYKVDEIPMWDSVERPRLLPPATGKAPFWLERTRERVRNGRFVELRLWDKKPQDGWSFSCYQLTGEEAPPAFYRFLMPVATDPAKVIEAAAQLGAAVAPLSGHGGYVFISHGSRTKDAFTAIHALARRYWAVDVEHLNATIGAMRDAIKGVCWLTLLGKKFGERLPSPLPDLEGVQKQTLAGGALLFSAGPNPVTADLNRRLPGLAPYRRLAAALEGLLPEEAPKLPGPFAEDDASQAWFRRLVEPDGWSHGRPVP